MPLVLTRPMGRLWQLNTQVASLATMTEGELTSDGSAAGGQSSVWRWGGSGFIPCACSIAVLHFFFNLLLTQHCCRHYEAIVSCHLAADRFSGKTSNVTLLIACVLPPSLSLQSPTPATQPPIPPPPILPPPLYDSYKKLWQTMLRYELFSV